MNNPSQEQDMPITHGGLTFPVWTTEELIPVMSKLTARKVEALKNAIGLSGEMPPREKAYMLAKELNAGTSIGEVYYYLTEIEGVDECLRKSLTKSNTPKETIDQFLATTKFEKKQELAMKVCNIFEYKPIVPNVTPPSAGAKQNEGKGLGDPSQKIVQTELPALGEGLKNP